MRERLETVETLDDVLLSCSPSSPERLPRQVGNHFARASALTLSSLFDLLKNVVRNVEGRTHDGSMIPNLWLQRLAGYR